MQCSATEQRLSFKETIASTTHIKIIIIVFVFLVIVITSMILMKFGLKERSPIEYNIIEGTIIQFNWDLGYFILDQWPIFRPELHQQFHAVFCIFV